MSNAFDPAAFMDMGTSEAGDTVVKPIPAGEYLAIIEKVDPRTVTTKNGESVVIDIHLVLQDPALAAQLGREKVSMRYGFFPDMKPDRSGFDMSSGKNIKLNQLRAATGLNTPGTPFKLPMLVGKPVKIKTSLREGDSPDVWYSDVKSVGKP